MALTGLRAAKHRPDAAAVNPASRSVATAALRRAAMTRADEPATPNKPPSSIASSTNQ